MQHFQHELTSMESHPFAHLSKVEPSTMPAGLRIWMPLMDDIPSSNLSRGLDDFLVSYVDLELLAGFWYTTAKTYWVSLQTSSSAVRQKNLVVLPSRFW